MQVVLSEFIYQHDDDYDRRHVADRDDLGLGAIQAALQEALQGQGLELSRLRDLRPVGLRLPRPAEPRPEFQERHRAYFYRANARTRLGHQHGVQFSKCSSSVRTIRLD